MSIFNRILFVANGAEAEQHALGHAAALAEAASAQVLTIMDVRPRTARASSRSDAPEDAGHGQGYSITQDSFQPLKDRSCVKIESGRDLQDVVEAAGDFDVVVKAAAVPGLRFLNGLAYEDRVLLRECPCPVWIVRRRQRRLHPRVLASIQFFDDKWLETTLAAEVTDYAAAAASADNAKVEAVHAWQIPHELELRARMNVNGLLGDFENANRRHLERLLEGCAMSPDKHHLVNGPVGEVIPPVAERRQANLVVVANTQRSRLARIFETSPAEQLLARLDCSVLVINRRAGEDARPARTRREVPLDPPQERIARSAHA